MPATIRLGHPQPLREMRLRLYDLDDRYYFFRVEGRSGSQWQTLLDGSQTPQRGCVKIPLGDKRLIELRITGLYNSEMRNNPLNQAIEVKKIELLP
jgi:hypothetical protein